MPTKKTKPFYKTTAWQKCRAFVLARDNYLCQPCLRKGKLTVADAVHHIVPLEEEPERALDPNNLESVCAACHNKAHPEKGGRKKEPEKKRKARIIEVKANEEVF